MMTIDRSLASIDTRCRQCYEICKILIMHTAITKELKPISREDDLFWFPARTSAVKIPDKGELLGRVYNDDAPYLWMQC